MEGNSFPQPKKPEAPASRVEVREGNRTSFEKLNEVMGRMAQEVNDMVKEKYGFNTLVDKEGRIDASTYEDIHGGIYTPEEIEADKKNVDWKDRDNSSADNPKVQAWYSDTYKIACTTECVIEQHRKNKNESKSNQAEMAITALLHKMLKDRFIVVRAALFDDYNNAMDNLILDRETGAVICAFDEVVRNESDDPRDPIKLEKIIKNAKRGGKDVKYGIALKEDTLVRSRLRNIPVFYLSIDSPVLNELANIDLNAEPTKFEQDFYMHLVTSIEQQKKILEGIPELPFATQNKLKAFEGSLGVLRGYCEVK